MLSPQLRRLTDLYTATGNRATGMRGQTLVIFTLFLVVLLGSAALTIDYSTWLKARRDYQNAADAAALSGAAYLTRPIDATKRIQAREAAWVSLKRQLNLTVDPATLKLRDTSAGTPDVDSGYRMWVSTPPIGAASVTLAKYPGTLTGTNDRAVFVWVEKDNPSYFSNVFGQGARNISAWATAGAFPSRFAVITLRKNGQATNGNPTDLDINGGTVLRVHDGDVGGNWGMSINGSGSKLQIYQSGLDSFGLYLTENVPTGGNGWTAAQLVDGSNNPILATYSPEVPDPNYAAPCLTYGVGGSTCLEDRTATFGASFSATTDRSGDTCPAAAGANASRLPPGRYSSIKIPNGKCVLLDPTLGSPGSKKNGVYYITGTLDINNSGLVIGDGVTVVFDRGAGLNMNAGASISLNSGNVARNPVLAAACGGPTECKYAAWTNRIGYNWTLGATPTYSAPADPFARGIAAYVCKNAAPCDGAGVISTNIIQMNSTDTGIDYQGLIYAPYDNVKVAGQPNHKDIGQIVSWTAQFTGGSMIDQTFDGPDSGTPYLIEPHIGQ